MLREIAINYHVRTEMDHSRDLSVSELQHAYLAASKFGVEGVEVRKAIAEVVDDKEIKRRIGTLQKDHDHAKRGSFLYESQRDIKSQEIKMAARDFAAGLISSLATATEAAAAAIRRSAKAINDKKGK